MDFRVRQVETRRYLSSEGETRLRSKLQLQDQLLLLVLGQSGRFA